MHHGRSFVEVVERLAGVAAAVLFAKHDEMRFRWPELVGRADKLVDKDQSIEALSPFGSRLRNSAHHITLIARQPVDPESKPIAATISGNVAYSTWLLSSDRPWTRRNLASTQIAQGHPYPRSKCSQCHPSSAREGQADLAWGSRGGHYRNLANAQVKGCQPVAPEFNEGAAMRKQVCRQLAGTNWRPIYAGYRGVLTG